MQNIKGWSTLQRFSVKFSFVLRLPQDTPIFLEPLKFFWSHFSFNPSIQAILALVKIFIDNARAVINTWIISRNGSGMNDSGHLGCAVSFGFDKDYLFPLHQVIPIHFHFMDRGCYAMSFQDFSFLVGFRIRRLWAIHRKTVFIVLGSHGSKYIRNFATSLLKCGRSNVEFWHLQGNVDTLGFDEFFSVQILQKRRWRQIWRRKLLVKWQYLYTPCNGLTKFSMFLLSLICTVNFLSWIT